MTRSFAYLLIPFRLSPLLAREVRLSDISSPLYLAYRSRYIASNMPILKVIPMCANLFVSARREVVISRKESKRLITA